jgi:class 3 adenylate cyclase
MSGMGTLVSFCFCILMTALTVAGFSYSFIVNGLWIDPVIPGAALATGALSSSLCALLIKKETEVWLRCAYCGITGETPLKKMVRSPILMADTISEKETGVKAAIVTVRRPDLATVENGVDAQKSSAVFRQFRNEVCSVFTKANAVICGWEGDAVSAAFGSPLEFQNFGGNKRRTVKKTLKPEKTPLNRAVEAVITLFKVQSATGSLYAGIDYGECVFGYTKVTRYTAAGSPVLRSRILAALAYRNKKSVFISKTAGEQIDSSMLSSAVPPSALSGDGIDASINELYYQLILPQ